jgi:hypothetical protein
VVGNHLVGRPHRAQRDDEQAQFAGQRAMHGGDARAVCRIHQCPMDLFVSIDDAAPADPLGAAHMRQDGDGVAQLGVERRDARAAVGLDHDEPLGGEPLQRAAHGHAGDVVGLDERSLDQQSSQIRKDD